MRLHESAQFTDRQLHVYVTQLSIAKILNKLGFEFKRQRGSHMFFAHPDGRTTVVPNHPREKVDRGLLNKIIKHDLQITREEFLKHC